MASKVVNKPRGEIAELTASLQSLCTMGKRSDKELKAQKREVFRKVINYLTVGKWVCMHGVTSLHAGPGQARTWPYSCGGTCLSNAAASCVVGH